MNRSDHRKLDSYMNALEIDAANQFWIFLSDTGSTDVDGTKEKQWIYWQHTNFKWNEFNWITTICLKLKKFNWINSIPLNIWSMLTIVLSELKPDSEHVPSNLSWHFLCTAVWQAENEMKIGLPIKIKLKLCLTI